METPRITVDEINQRQDKGEKFVFLDCRNSEAWGESDVMTPNALRVDSHNIEPSLPRIPHDVPIISYCT